MLFYSDVSPVADHRAMGKILLDVLEVVDVMYACRREVIRENYTGQTTNAVQLIAMKIAFLTGTIARIRHSVIVFTAYF